MRLGPAVLVTCLAGWVGCTHPAPEPEEHPSDASTPEVDAGTVPIDGGTAADAGPSSDAGQARLDGGRVDLNDVSILLPLPDTAASNALPRLDFQCQSGPLLPSAAFAELIQLANPELDPTFKANHFDDPANWRVVAVRVDPCHRADPSTAECSSQLRLVAQALASPANAAAGMADQAIHLIYDLGPGPNLPLIRDLLELKAASPVDTRGTALGVHPALRQEGPNGPYALALRAFISKHAGIDRLPFATVMLTLNAGTWRFAKGEYVNGHFQQVQPPLSAAKTIDFVGTTGVIGNFILGVAPAATGADNVNEIVDSSGRDEASAKQGSFYKLSAAAQALRVDAALRIDNPLRHGVATTDCVSCHQASRSLARVKGPQFLSANDGNPNRYAFPPELNPQLTADPVELRGEYSVRAFGYQFRAVSLTQNALNDTARVAQGINQLLGL